MMCILKKCCLAVLVVLSEFHFNSCDISLVEYSASSDEKSGHGESLFLTPLIEKGLLSEARKRASVNPFLKNIASYAGYFTVNKDYNSNLFFWFFKAQDKNWESLPVAVWLQGGPGGSSLVGLFVENGPYILKNKKLSTRLFSWHRKCNMIYIDNPVGTGFSFTDYDEGYARNQTVIGEQLYSAIKQFFILFPNLAKNEFYISGESYAGKYVPALAYTIHKKNVANSLLNGDDNVFINLKGLFIGNGLVDPYNMLQYGDYLYQLGLIDTKTKKEIHGCEARIKRAIKMEKWSYATQRLRELVTDSSSLIKNVTGFQEVYNYINLNSLDWTSRDVDFLNSNLFRRFLHIGDRLFSNGDKVAEALNDDISKSVVGLVEELLDHYRIVFYNGQLDIIVAYPLTVNFIKNMKWASAHEYATAERHIWKVGNDIAGYYKTAGNLTEVLVRAAGHLVPSDQPLWAYELFNKFIYNKEF